jgi:hypothetical protein
MFQLWGMFLRSRDKRYHIWHERLHDRHDEAVAYLKVRPARNFVQRAFNAMVVFVFEKDKPDR